MPGRKKLPQSVKQNIPMRSGRRCCICVGLHGDSSVKHGQIAHLDRISSNNDENNLVFLCLDHHNQYDSQTSQSKGFLKGEVQTYRDQLYAKLPSLLAPQREAGDVSVSGNLAAGDGLAGSGGNIIVEGGTGRGGASGGNVTIGSGTYKAGDGGPGGPGGDIRIKGGDAE